MTAILNNPRERTRFFRFLVVGLFGAIVDFGIENLLHRFFGVPYVWAGTISFICAVFSNFFWNRYWTYPDSRSKPLAHQASQFLTNHFYGYWPYSAPYYASSRSVFGHKRLHQFPSISDNEYRTASNRWLPFPLDISSL